MTPKLLTKTAEPFTTKIKTPDASKARKDLDFKLTVAPEDGIRRTVDWFKELYDKQSV